MWHAVFSNPGEDRATFVDAYHLVCLIMTKIIQHAIKLKSISSNFATQY